MLTFNPIATQPEFFCSCDQKPKYENAEAMPTRTTWGSTHQPVTMTISAAYYSLAVSVLDDAKLVVLDAGAASDYTWPLIACACPFRTRQAA